MWQMLDSFISKLSARQGYILETYFIFIYEDHFLPEYGFIKGVTLRVMGGPH